MKKDLIELILSGKLEHVDLTETEKEIAQTILSELEGTVTLRATSILEFCLKAIQYSRVTF